MMGIGGDQIDDLWNGLNLGGLLNDLQQENNALQKLKRKQDPFYKHNKVVESPAYNVLMERYHTRPSQPKILSKKTLDRLSDPVKGRIYESPPKETKLKSSIDIQTKIQPERIDKSLQKNPSKKAPIRYHSPIRHDQHHLNYQHDGEAEEVEEVLFQPDEESVSGGENSPTNHHRKERRDDSDSFFLTGTIHSEVNQKTVSYHPVMDVRIDMNQMKKTNTSNTSTTAKKGKNPFREDMNDENDEIYTARTREYLQEALLRSQTTSNRQSNRSSERERDSRNRRRVPGNKSEQQPNFTKEMNSKKLKNIKIKQPLTKKEKLPLNDFNSKKTLKNSKISSTSTSTTKQQSLKDSNKIEKSTKWASSREPSSSSLSTLQNKSGNRKKVLLAPVAGIQSKKSGMKNKKLIPRKDNLVGLERVDEEYSQQRSEVLLRSVSSSGPTRDPQRKQQQQSSSSGIGAGAGVAGGGRSSNLIGSRSAPTLSSRKLNSLGDHTTNTTTNTETTTTENELPYRVHAPVSSRLLSKPNGMTRKPSLPTSERSQKSSAVSLPPIDSTNNQPSSSHRSIGRPPLPSSNGSISRSNSKVLSTSSSSSMTQIDPSDDHLAALFSAHAKKLSDNLDKATNLSLKYKQLKEFDGMTAANRGEEKNLMLPNRSVSNSNSNQNNNEESLEPIEKKPERYSIIV